MWFSAGLYFGSTPANLTVTRASVAYASTAAGIWSPFAANIPRITDLGLWVEESRTNSIRNNSMQGAVAGSPGTRPTNWSAFTLAGLTQTIVGTGTENGVDYIDIRFNGTTSATQIFINFEGSTAVAASNGQTWTQSVFLSLVGGDLTNVTAFQLIFNMRDSGGANLTSLTSNLTNPTASFARQSGSATLNNASTAFLLPILALSVNNTSAVDLTLRIGWPQLELGSFATSPIRTTSAAATRAADLVTLTLGSWFNQSEGTVYGQYTPTQVQTGGGVNPVLQLKADANNRILQRSGTVIANTDLFALVGGVNVVDTNSFNLTLGSSAKTAYAYKLNDYAFVANAGTVLTDTSATVPASMTTLEFVASGFLGSYLFQRVGYFPSRISNAQLQAITT